MRLEDKKILITGATGFIGKHLIAELEKKDLDLSSFDRNMGDIRDWTKIKKIDDVDIVYHLAATTFVPFSFKNPRETYEVNIVGTLNVLELCRLCNIEKLVFASSYIYGRPEYLPIDEKHSTNTTNPYMHSKAMGEELCRKYHEDYGINCIILRPFNIFGEGQNPNFLIPSIIKQIFEKGKIKINDPDPRRDLLYVNDLIDAYIKAGEYSLTKFEIFNIGYGKSYSVKEIVDKILDIYGNEIKVDYLHERRRNEIMDVVANIEKAKSMLDWTPKTTLEKGLKNVLATYTR